MKAFVITIMDNPKSVAAADRCVRSGATWGVPVEKFKAITPSDSPIKIASEKQIPIEGFEEKYSRFDRCLSAFLSHYSLWEKCIEERQPMVVLEHDAYFVNGLPLFIGGHIVNLGQPSYGRFRIPQILGEGPLQSKRYLPGAHGYYIDPKGAKLLVERANTDAAPTDVFINLDHFKDIKELYPWPIEARDSFTTIQNETGCGAKHNWHKDSNYEIL